MFPLGPFHCFRIRDAKRVPVIIRLNRLKRKIIGFRTPKKIVVTILGQKPLQPLAGYGATLVRQPSMSVSGQTLNILNPSKIHTYPKAIYAVLQMRRTARIVLLRIKNGSCERSTHGTKPNTNTPNENNRQEQVRPWTMTTNTDGIEARIHDNMRFHSRWLRQVEVDGIANKNRVFSSKGTALLEVAFDTTCIRIHCTDEILCCAD